MQRLSSQVATSVFISMDTQSKWLKIAIVEQPFNNNYSHNQFYLKPFLRLSLKLVRMARDVYVLKLSLVVKTVLVVTSWNTQRQPWLSPVGMARDNPDLTSWNS